MPWLMDAGVCSEQEEMERKEKKRLNISGSTFLAQTLRVSEYWSGGNKLRASGLFLVRDSESTELLV